MKSCAQTLAKQIVNALIVLDARLNLDQAIGDMSASTAVSERVRSIVGEIEDVVVLQRQLNPERRAGLRVPASIGMRLRSARWKAASKIDALKSAARLPLDRREFSHTARSRFTRWGSGSVWPERQPRLPRAQAEIAHGVRDNERPCRRLCHQANGCRRRRRNMATTDP